MLSNMPHTSELTTLVCVSYTALRTLPEHKAAAGPAAHRSPSSQP